MCWVTRKVTWMLERQRSSASLNMEFTGPWSGNGKIRTWGWAGVCSIDWGCVFAAGELLKVFIFVTMLSNVKILSELYLHLYA